MGENESVLTIANLKIEYIVYNMVPLSKGTILWYRVKISLKWRLFMTHSPIEIIYDRNTYPGTDIFGFYLGNYEGSDKDNNSIWLTEDNLYFVYPMICKHFPQFDMYELDNNISLRIWREIISEINIYIDLITNDPENPALVPYIDFVGLYCTDLSSIVEEKNVLVSWAYENKFQSFMIGRLEVVQFLKEFSVWVENQIKSKKHKYLNVEGV